MTTGCWIIQLYNVPTTNRLNLLGYSFPQKTIRVQGASLKVVIMLPFWVLSLASQLRQEEVGNISAFLSVLSAGWETQLSERWNLNTNQGRDGGRAKKHLTPEKRQRVGKLCSLSCAKRGEGSFPTTKWSEGERERECSHWHVSERLWRVVMRLSVSRCYLVSGICSPPHLALPLLCWNALHTSGDTKCNLD